MPLLRATLSAPPLERVLTTLALSTLVAGSLAACCNCGSDPTPVPLPDAASPMLGAWVNGSGDGITLRADGTADVATSSTKPTPHLVTFADDTFTFNKGGFLDLDFSASVTKWPYKKGKLRCVDLDGTFGPGTWTAAKPLTAEQRKTFGGRWSDPAGNDLMIRSDGYASGSIDGEFVSGAVVITKDAVTIESCTEKRLSLKRVAAALVLGALTLDRSNAQWEEELAEHSYSSGSSSGGGGGGGFDFD